jgi:tetratricopeptide (TPR) repeat protein
MSGEDQKPSGLIHSQSDGLSKVAATALAARGRVDLCKMDEALEWLRRGKALYTLAMNDRGQTILDEERNSRSKPHPHIRFSLIAEYLERVLAGSDPESVAKSLNMTTDDQELAHTLHFFLPSSLPILVCAEKQGEDEKQSYVSMHQQTLKEAFRCFQRGLALAPNNTDLLGELADCYSEGWGVEEDQTMGLALLQKAAELGDFRAQTALGQHYLALGTAGPNRELAIFWLRKAAAQGDDLALRALQRLDLEP